MSNIERILKDTEVKIENLGSCLKERGMIVDVSFGGGRNSYRVPLKSLGVDERKLSEESKEFFGNHTRDGIVVFVPPKEYKALRAIESRTKKKLAEVAIGYNNRFVPIEDFEEFVEYFEKAKEEYFEIRNELLENYTEMVSEFKKILANYFTDLNVEDWEDAYAKIINSLPSESVFKDSFRAEMSVSLLPTMNEFEDYGLDDKIKETINNQYEELGKSLIGNSTVLVLQEAIDSLSNVISGYNRTGKLHHMVIKSLENCTVKMRRKNIFGNNKLEKIRVSLEELIDSDIDMIVQQSEITLSEIYMYSKELNIEDRINLDNVSLTPRDLESLYDIFN